MAKKSALLSVTAIILLYSSVPAYAQSVTNVYDGAGRLIKQTIPNKNLIFLYTYDRNGNLIARKADVSSPTAPGNLSLSFLRENAATVTWTPSTDDRGIEKYEFSLASPNSVKSGTLDKSSSTLPFSELQASTTYTFSIKAVDVAGRLSTSSTLTFRTKDITIPTRPTLQSLDSDGPVVTLRWQASTDPEGIKEYVVYLNGVEKGRTSSTTYTISNLPYRQSLSFAVRAIDNYGYVSDASNGSINLIPKDQIDFAGSYRAGIGTR
ncbi:fibronectin type III domain-containing protein [Gorillibacterium sp. CAU 1737]|uniref:fibronectin type III domain-containing protein n=1 Tax=Gorillibacterium sp. CAU 1737 TaxID=3140362 RepID=UPI0032601FB1